MTIWSKFFPFLLTKNLCFLCAACWLCFEIFTLLFSKHGDAFLLRHNTYVCQNLGKGFSNIISCSPHSNPVIVVILTFIDGETEFREVK